MYKRAIVTYVYLSTVLPASSV